MATVDGQVVNKNDIVCFKRGVEQYGRVVKINGNVLTIEVRDEMSGEYEGKCYQEEASRCWIE